MIDRIVIPSDVHLTFGVRVMLFNAALLIVFTLLVFNVGGLGVAAVLPVALLAAEARARHPCTAKRCIRPVPGVMARLAGVTARGRCAGQSWQDGDAGLWRKSLFKPAGYLRYCGVFAQRSIE
jgi:hypothetical protein